MSYFAVHMQNRLTGQKRIKRIEAENVDEATRKAGFCDSNPWRWTGSEPWRNVADEAIHLSSGYYTMPGWDE